MQKIPSVVAQSQRNYKRYVAMQTIPHVVDYLYSLALRDDAVNSARSCPECYYYNYDAVNSVL